MSISILLLTLNEAANLPACMAALAWADDVVVLDSFSQDDTVAVAVDAPKGVATNAAGADGGAKAAGRYDAWRLPSKMMFMGRWLRYSGLYPSYQVRLGHRDRFPGCTSPAWWRSACWRRSGGGRPGWSSPRSGWPVGVAGVRAGGLRR